MLHPEFLLRSCPHPNLLPTLPAAFLRLYTSAMANEPVSPILAQQPLPPQLTVKQLK